MGAEDLHLVPEGRCRERDHPPELATPHDTDADHVDLLGSLR
jgi:hypothetical protein